MNKNEAWGIRIKLTARPKNVLFSYLSATFSSLVSEVHNFKFNFNLLFLTIYNVYLHQYYNIKSETRNTVYFASGYGEN